MLVSPIVYGVLFCLSIRRDGQSASDIIFTAVSRNPAISLWKNETETKQLAT